MNAYSMGEPSSELAPSCADTFAATVEINAKGFEHMKRIIVCVLAFVVVISALGCGNQSSLADAYIEAFNILYEKDPGLNGDITFIALQLNDLQGIEEKDKDKIIKAFSEKGYEVKNASLEDLKASGEFDDKVLLIKNGILIRVDKIREITDAKIIFEASKYRSGTGAIGFLFTFVKENNKWVLKESSGLWIS